MNFIRGKYFIFALNCILFSKDTTFLREYSYTPSKFDTKETAREISINEAKTILLEEVGVFIKSEFSTEVKLTENIDKYKIEELNEQKLTSLTAGITKTKIIEEKWIEKKWLKNSQYWVKLEITLDPDSVYRKIQKVLEKKELLADLEESRNLIIKSKNELKRLENQLTFSNEKNLDLQKQYDKQINTLYVNKYIENGIHYLNEDNLIEAKSQFINCINIDPENQIALQNLGYIHYENGDYQSAENLFIKLIEVNPNFSYPYHYLGHIYFKSGELDKAIKQYEQAIKVKINWFRVFLICLSGCIYPYTILYLKKHKVYPIKFIFYANFPEVRKYYALISLSMVHILILFNYRSLVENNIQETFENKYYSNSYAYDNIGLVYQALGNYQKSIKLFKKSLSVKPDNLRSHINLGDSYLKTENYDLSIGSYNNAININPKDASIYHKLGEVYSRINDYDKALKMFIKATEIDTMYAQSYWSCGKEYERREKIETALGYYEMSIRKFESTKSITLLKLQNLYYELGLKYLNIKDVSNMTAAFKKASELDNKFFRNWKIRKRKSKNLLNQQYTVGYEIVDHNSNVVIFYTSEVLSGQGVTKNTRLKNAKKSATKWLNKLQKL